MVQFDLWFGCWAATLPVCHAPLLSRGTFLYWSIINPGGFCKIKNNNTALLTDDGWLFQSVHNRKWAKFPKGKLSRYHSISWPDARHAVVQDSYQHARPKHVYPLRPSFLGPTVVDGMILMVGMSVHWHASDPGSISDRRVTCGWNLGFQPASSSEGIPCIDCTSTRFRSKAERCNFSVFPSLYRLKLPGPACSKYTVLPPPKTRQLSKTSNPEHEGYEYMK